MCQQWRLLPKNTEVDEDAPWTCADGQRKCTESCDSVLPEIVEEAPDAATSIEVAVPDAVEPLQPALPHSGAEHACRWRTGYGAAQVD